MIGIVGSLVVLGGLEVVRYCFKSIGMGRMIMEVRGENWEGLKGVWGKLSWENFEIRW